MPSRARDVARTTRDVAAKEIGLLSSGATTAERSFWDVVGAAVVSADDDDASREDSNAPLRAGSCVAMYALGAREGRGMYAARDGGGRSTRANDAPAATEGKRALEFSCATLRRDGVSTSTSASGGGADIDSLMLTARDASTQLVVLRFGEFYGFRSHAAGGKLLQARRKAASELCFYNYNFGVCEQWELVSVDHERATYGRAMLFRNRRFEHVTINAAVVEVPKEFLPKYALDDMSLYDDDLAYVEYGTSYYGSDTESETSVLNLKPLAAPPSPSAAANASPSKPKSKQKRVEQQPVLIEPPKPAESAPSWLSAAIVQKWTRIFKDEIEIRRGVERELEGLREELKIVEKSWMNSVQTVQLEFESINNEALKTMRKTMQQKMRKRVQAVQVKAIERMTRTSARAFRDETFKRWRAFADKERRKRVGVVRFLLRADRRGLGAAFDAWKNYANTRKLKRERDALLSARRRESLARQFFDRWKSCASESNQTRRIAARAHRRALTDKSRELKQKVFVSWYLYAKRGKHVAKIQRLAVHKMRERLMFDAFECWKKRAEERKSFTQRLMRTFARWDNRTACAAFLKWKEVVDDSRHAKKTYNGVLLCWNKDSRKTLTKLHFFAWRTTARFVRVHREKMYAVTRERMKNNTTRIVFHNWKMLSARRQREEQHQRGVVHAMASLRFKYIRANFDAWRSQTIKSAFRKHTVSKFMNKLRRYELLRAFQGWRYRTHTLRTQRRSVAATLTRWRQRVLLSSWNQWKFATQEHSKLIAVSALAIFNRQRQSRLRRSFAIWRGMWRAQMVALVKMRASHQFATRNHYFTRWRNAIRQREEMQRMVVSKRVTHNLFLDWYWETFGEQFTRLIEGNDTDEYQTLVRVDDPEVELFHTPLRTPEKVFWSPPKPRRIL